MKQQNRRNLEEIVLSCLLNQLKKEQLNFLLKIDKTLFLSQKEKEYYENILKSTMKNNYDNLFKNNIDSNYFQDFIRSFFPSKFRVEKIYEKKQSNPSKVTKEDLIQIMDYYSSSRDEYEYEKIYIEFLYNVIESNTVNKTQLIELFYEQIYTPTSHSKRVALMNYLQETKRTGLMDEICIISEERGLPGIVFEEIALSTIKYEITIHNKNNNKRKFFNEDDTVYNLIEYTSLAFNINFCFCYLEFQSNNQPVKITSQNSRQLVREVFNETKIDLILIQIESKELYYTKDKNLLSTIEEILIKWRNSFSLTDYFCKEYFFPHLHENDIFKPIVTSFFKDYSKISKDEFITAAKNNETVFCIFHLIVGYDIKNIDKPFVKNTSFFEMPRTILTHSKLSIFDKIVKVKKQFFGRIIDRKYVTMLIDNSLFFFSFKHLNIIEKEDQRKRMNYEKLIKAQNDIKELYSLYSQAETTTKKTVFCKLYKIRENDWISCIPNLLWIFALFIQVSIHTENFIRKKNHIDSIWKTFALLADEKKNDILNDLQCFCCNLLCSSDLKSYFVNSIDKGILTNYYSFVSNLFTSMLKEKCILCAQNEDKVLGLFEYFDMNNIDYYPIVLFFYGYYYSTRINFSDKKEKLIKKASQVYDKLYRLSVYYCLNKSDNLDSKTGIRDKGIINFNSIKLSISDCSQLLLGKKLFVIDHDLFH